jgi:hypothetical protein
MDSTKIPYLYITGASYSGSTLLAFLLDAHPQIVSVAEIGGLARGVVPEKYQCSCGTLLSRCPFFLELEQRINVLGSSFSLKDWQTIFRLSRYRLLDIPLVRPLRNVFLERIRDRLVPLFWPGYQRVVGVISQRNVHLAQAALEISGKRVFVDATKDSIRIKFLRDIEQLNLKVVHLVRDVRGAIVSIMKNRGIDDVARATRVWCNANMNSERAKRYVSSQQWLRIKYDELCTDTQGAVDRITDFLEVNRAPIPRDFYEGEHHILGNRMRRKGRGAGMVKLDEAWKEHLSKYDLDLIARIGGAANRYFGHDWP